MFPDAQAHAFCHGHSPASTYCRLPLKKKTVYSLDSSRSEMVLLTSVLEETTAGRNTGHIYALYFCFHVLYPFFHPLLLFELWFSKLAGDWI